MAKSKPIRLSQEEKGVLKSWSQSGRTEQRLAERARMILALAEGQTNREVALRLRTRQAPRQQVAHPLCPARERRPQGCASARSASAL